MHYKVKAQCPICGEDKTSVAETMRNCNICGIAFETDSTCVNDHYVCALCRQKGARAAMIAHCLKSGQVQPYPLVMELMQLPGVAMHGPEHHLLLTAALLTAHCNEKGEASRLAAFLEEANARSMGVPGGACGFWGICGAAIAAGIYMSILTDANPCAEAEWKMAGQLTARCANAVSDEGGPRCCKRDTFLSLAEAVRYSNEVLGTHFTMPDDVRCIFYANNEQCKRGKCPFFPNPRGEIRAQS